MHAGEEREVARRFRRREHVVDRARELGVRQRHRHHRGAGDAEVLAAASRRARIGRRATREVFLREADATSRSGKPVGHAALPPRSDGTGASALVASSGSKPAMTSSASAASSTQRPITPTWSSDDANATSPWRLTRPYVGFTPTTPQSPPAA
jgi:hypothetical protein